MGHAKASRTSLLFAGSLNGMNPRILEEKVINCSM